MKILLNIQKQPSVPNFQTITHNYFNSATHIACTSGKRREIDLFFRDDNNIMICPVSCKRMDTFCIEWCNLPGKRIPGNDKLWAQKVSNNQKSSCRQLHNDIAAYGLFCIAVSFNSNVQTNIMNLTVTAHEIENSQMTLSCWMLWPYSDHGEKIEMRFKSTSKLETDNDSGSLVEYTVDETVFMDDQFQFTTHNHDICAKTTMLDCFEDNQKSCDDVKNVITFTLICDHRTIKLYSDSDYARKPTEGRSQCHHDWSKDLIKVASYR